MSVLPLDKQEGVIWQDGQFVDWHDSKIHLLTHALHYGTSVFEGIRVYDGRIFKLQEHNERLLKSAKSLGIEVSYDLEEINEVTAELVEKQNIRNGYIRSIAWLGSYSMKIEAVDSNSHMAIAAWSAFENFQTKIVKLDVAKWRKPPSVCYPHAAKAAGPYMMSMIIKKEAISNGYDDAIVLDTQDYITEATVANIFFIQGNKLITPRPDNFLNGITRQTIINLAKEKNIVVEEAKIKVEDLQDMDAAFLTGTAAEISPIEQIKEYKFNPKHPLLESLHQGYRNLVFNQ